MEENNSCNDDLYTVCFFSFRITDAAEVSGTKQDVTDYKQISALISDTWDDDYFEKMVITPGTDTMEKMGNRSRFQIHLMLVLQKQRV